MPNLLRTLKSADVSNQDVIIRCDLNVPLNENLEITDDSRIKASLPTLEYLGKYCSKVIILSHLGRPIEGEFDPCFSLKPVAESLSAYLNTEVPLISDFRDLKKSSSQFELFENVRFHEGEKENKEELIEKYLEHADFFIMDAFGSSHRAHATTYGIAKKIKNSFAGFLLESEVDALERVSASREHPYVAIVGGSKVSTKIEILKKLSSKVDYLIPGGGIANTLLMAKGINTERSLVESSMLDFSNSLLNGEFGDAKVLLPTDVTTADSINNPKEIFTDISVDQIPKDQLILDIGKNSAKEFSNFIAHAKTIIWNGPLGVFEVEAFSMGTKLIGEAIKRSDAYSFAGGGDTVAAINKFNLSEGMSYISTGGGASLEYLSGKKLPGIEVLK